MFPRTSTFRFFSFGPVYLSVSVLVSHHPPSIAPVSSSAVQSSPASRWNHCMNTPGCIELTWNYGTENEDGRVYNTGNADGGVRGGFGHIGITVPNVYEACERFRALGVEFHKSPNSGGMKGLAFVRDPDGYLIEVLPRGGMVVEAVDCLGVAAEGGAGYVDNSK
jgi:lactoylglutathione lyase